MRPCRLRMHAPGGVNIQGGTGCICSDGGMEAETALLLRVANSDMGALRELYDGLSGHVFALALAMLGNREDAEEAVQDAFVKLHSSAGRFDPKRGSVRAYLYTIARNEARMRLRARRARPHKAERVDLHEPDASFAATTGPDPVTNVMVARALATLPADDAELVRGSFFLGLSHVELAERMRVPLGTVKSRIRRALVAMRKEIEGP